LIDKYFSRVHPKSAEHLRLSTRHGNAKPSVEIIEIQCELQMSFEHFLDRNRCDKTSSTTYIELRQQQGCFVLYFTC